VCLGESDGEGDEVKELKKDEWDGIGLGKQIGTNPVQLALKRLQVRSGKTALEGIRDLRRVGPRVVAKHKKCALYCRRGYAHGPSLVTRLSTNLEANPAEGIKTKCVRRGFFI